MIHTVKAVRMLQVVASVVGIAILLWSLGLPTFVRDADAANLTSVSDTLSDSDLGVNANHTIAFTVPNGLIDGENIVITFPISAGEFTLPSAGFDFNDLDVTVGGVEITLVDGTGSGDSWGVATTSSTITLDTSSTTLGAATVASSTEVIVEIGSNATAGATGNSFIANPTAAGSYEILIAGSMQDSGSTIVAIIDDVVVTADVNATFTFSISGVATSSTVNGGATTTAGSSTATSIPFGTLVSGTTTVMAQDLTVSTNAKNGFVVTVQQATDLQSSTGAIIDGFIDGQYTNSPSTWQTPSGDVNATSTWGHWGLTSEDDLNADEFGTDKWVAASTTPRQIFENNGPADGAIANVGSTRIGYQVEITDLQEAGDDYSTTLTYVATPTF